MMEHYFIQGRYNHERECFSEWLVAKNKNEVVKKYKKCGIVLNEILDKKEYRNKMNQLIDKWEIH